MHHLSEAEQTHETLDILRPSVVFIDSTTLPSTPQPVSIFQMAHILQLCTFKLCGLSKGQDPRPLSLVVVCLYLLIQMFFYVQMSFSGC